MPGGSLRPFGTCGAFCLLTEIPQACSLSSVALRGVAGGSSSSLKSTTSTLTLSLGFKAGVRSFTGEGIGGGADTGGCGAPGLGAPGLTMPGGLGPLGRIGPPGRIPLGGGPLGPPGRIPRGPGAPGLIGIRGLIPGLTAPRNRTPPRPLIGLTGLTPGPPGVVDSPPGIPGVPGWGPGAPGRNGEFVAPWINGLMGGGPAIPEATTILCPGWIPMGDTEVVRVPGACRRTPRPEVPETTI